MKMASNNGPKKPKILPKKQLSNVKIILFQPVVGPNGIVQDKMSLNTLLEAAKFLEMQEQRQHRATLDSALATTTIRPVTAVSGGATHMQNGVTILIFILFAQKLQVDNHN